MLKRVWTVKLVRFVAAGIVNTIIDVTILNTLVFFGHFPELVANLISASTSICVSYFLNHRVVFRSPEPYSLNRFVRFFALTGFGILAIQSFVIYVVTHLMSGHRALATKITSHIPIVHLSVKVFDLNLAKFAAIAIAMCWNFAIYHLVVFRKQTEEVDIADFELPL
jgi:putative flippase GtrA